MLLQLAREVFKNLQRDEIKSDGFARACTYRVPQKGFPVLILAGSRQTYSNIVKQFIYFHGPHTLLSLSVL